MQETTDEPPAVIPAQRVPTHDVLPPTPPRRRRRVVLPVLLTLLLGTVLAVPVGTVRHPLGTLTAVAGPPRQVPKTPFELVEEALDGQAAALVRGDQAGWLAGVDPGQPVLRKRYQDLYASLTALHVTQFSYRPTIAGQAGTSITVRAEATFCFSADTCPTVDADSPGGPPGIDQMLTLDTRGDRYVITKLAASKQQTQLQPMPWENGDLVYAQGRRVTVAAPRTLAKRLPKVLAVAERAAVTDDRIAAYMDNVQKRYRIYLATDRTWKTWYGGEKASYSVAYTIGLNGAGSDVVLRMSHLDDAAELQVVVQHEMAHVATLSNLTGVDRRDLWLMEGVADYAGWLPRHSRSDWDFPAVRAALLGGHPPRSIVQAPLKDSASGRAVDAFYGLGHFAVDCLVATYGEAKAMDFVRRKLHTNDSLDLAAREAFGTTFAAVDRGCLAWMRNKAR